MGKIHVLAPEIIEKIAAGEVVERPASVLKELLENAVDAGAKTINIDFEDAGRALIRVNDDGCGMEAGDLERAVLRHATSKISAYEDLDSLCTFGFRGEALYATAAVSRLAVSTCARGENMRGARITVEGGKLLSRTEAPPVPGTTVEVRDLFFNVPARLKFLKSAGTERSHLLRAAEECILANAGIAFNVRADGSDIYCVPAGAALAERAAIVLGEAVSSGMICADDGAAGIAALVSAPDKMPATRALQYFFVNRRPVNCKTLSQALYRAYEGYRPKTQHPACVLFIELPPSEFDVNIHPQKRDVRFKNESRIFKSVANAVSGAVIGGAAPPPALPPEAAGRAAPPRLEEETPPSRVSLEEISMLMGGAAREAAPSVRETEHGVVIEGFSQSEQDPDWWKPPYRHLGQIHGSYLVYECADGMIVVDQHAAQERVFYEEYLRQLSARMPVVQRLMLPVIVDVSASVAEAVMSWQQYLCEAGFEIEQSGPAELMVRSVPSVFHFSDADIGDFITRFAQTAPEPQPQEQARREAVAMAACKRAVKAGDRLSPPEAMRLIYDLKSCREGLICPHGRPTMITLESGELARRFKRPKSPY
ncbi:MAG: DNA mismatch repair endonuclease MutL [Elusimicrobiales bacterium]